MEFCFVFILNIVTCRGNSKCDFIYFILILQNDYFILFWQNEYLNAIILFQV